MRAITNNIISLLISIAVLAMAGGCGGVLTTEEFFQSYRVRSGTTIEIYNPNGEVIITGWDQDQVEISALKETFSGKEALEEVEIFIDIADRMIIRTEHPDQDSQVTVNYNIKVPEDVFIEVVECSNGDINLESIAGNPYLMTSNGSISAININGIVAARSGNGNITVTGVRGLGNLRTSNGSIEAELPALHENIEIRTSNGSITLYLNTALEVDLEAGTSNGTVNVNSLNMDISEQEQSSLSGSLNGGGYRVGISTSNGSIDLLSLR